MTTQEYYNLHYIDKDGREIVEIEFTDEEVLEEEIDRKNNGQKVWVTGPYYYSNGEEA